MSNNKELGEQGELLASEYLVKNGYEILEKNYRYKKSEIDIIALKKNWLVFVEVKMRKNADYGYPEEFVDEKKEEMVQLGAVNYMEEINWQGNVRYDIVAIIKKRIPEIMHIEDAF